MSDNSKTEKILKKPVLKEHNNGPPKASKHVNFGTQSPNTKRRMSRYIKQNTGVIEAIENMNDS